MSGIFNLSAQPTADMAKYKPAPLRNRLAVKLGAVHGIIQKNSEE